MRTADGPETSVRDATRGYAARGLAVVPLYGVVSGVCECRKRENCPNRHEQLAIRQRLEAELESLRVQLLQERDLVRETLHTRSDDRDAERREAGIARSRVKQLRQAEHVAVNTVLAASRPILQPVQVRDTTESFSSGCSSRSSSCRRNDLQTRTKSSVYVTYVEDAQVRQSRLAFLSAARDRQAAIEKSLRPALSDSQKQGAEAAEAEREYWRTARDVRSRLNQLETALASIADMQSQLRKLPQSRSEWEARRSSWSSYCQFNRPEERQTLLANL